MSAVKNAIKGQLAFPYVKEQLANNKFPCHKTFSSLKCSAKAKDPNKLTRTYKCLQIIPFKRPQDDLPTQEKAFEAFCLRFFSGAPVYAILLSMHVPYTDTLLSMCYQIDLVQFLSSFPGLEIHLATSNMRLTDYTAYIFFHQSFSRYRFIF